MIQFIEFNPENHINEVFFSFFGLWMPIPLIFGKESITCFPDVSQFSAYEIEKMQRAIINTVLILQKKEYELNKQGIHIN